jgi:polar amino acid transport system substrate-binding protein
MNARRQSRIRRGMLSAVPVALVAAMGAPFKAAAASPAEQQAIPTLDAIRSAGELKVGMTLQFKPEMYRDESTNQPMGYDVDLVQQMASDLNVKLTISDLPFDGLIPGLQANQLDLISVGLVNRPARALAMWFSQPYVPYRQVLVVPASSTISSPSELNAQGKRVTALTGSTAADLAHRLFPQADIVELEQQPALLEVASGRADGAIVEEYLGKPFVKQNPSVKILNPDQPFSLEYGCYAVRRGDVDFLVWVNNWVDYWKAKGLLDAKYAQWIGPTVG